jgi:hypothetical protein
MAIEVERIQSESLHELNKGHYLNLFGKQHTMKIGFIVNDNPQKVKIFKSIQLILNTKYKVKNVGVETSFDQTRNIDGRHPAYRITEGMHVVPLKNPRDFDDLRGNWAYIEIEIESIDNSKVDLFAVNTFLRLSTI